MNDSLLGFLFSPWGWLSLGAILAGLEILLPGAYLIWLAAAAVGTAATVAMLNLTLDGQLGAFALWIIAALLASRRFRYASLLGGRDSGLNKPATRLVGRTVVVTQALAGGRGRVRLGDSEWIAAGTDAAVGTELLIEGMDGAILKVGPAQPPLPAAAPEPPAPEPPAASNP